jgi:hypothetical protein
MTSQIRSGLDEFFQKVILELDMEVALDWLIVDDSIKANLVVDQAALYYAAASALADAEADLTVAQQQLQQLKDQIKVERAKLSDELAYLDARYNDIARHELERRRGKFTNDQVTTTKLLNESYREELEAIRQEELDLAANTELETCICSFSELELRVGKLKALARALEHRRELIANRSHFERLELRQ